MKKEQSSILTPNNDLIGVKKGGKIPPQLKKFVMAKKKKAKMKKKK